MIRIIIAILCVYWVLSLSGCGDECKKYSKFTCKQLDKMTYNVYFYFPNDYEKYLGVAKGLDECGAFAYSYADDKHLDRYSNWSYICCLRTKDSECAERHR